MLLVTAYLVGNGEEELLDSTYHRNQPATHCEDVEESMLKIQGNLTDRDNDNDDNSNFSFMNSDADTIFRWCRSRNYIENLPKITKFTVPALHNRPKKQFLVCLDFSNNLMHWHFTLISLSGKTKWEKTWIWSSYL
ncbi:unnamed protein product [Gongylonema pulchrum]|uniref:DDE_Tnp_1_7 domain-containing protein n=1 Tax=Gongylonema pulchrum TaxID=637853 RepID=A0A183E7W4_9BILA|nr:unnamed protein product [Gongylonema pulchrum]